MLRNVLTLIVRFDHFNVRWYSILYPIEICFVHFLKVVPYEERPKYIRITMRNLLHISLSANHHDIIIHEITCSDLNIINELSKIFSNKLLTHWARISGKAERKRWEKKGGKERKEWREKIIYLWGKRYIPESSDAIRARIHSVTRSSRR